jgi:hypothetical protein
MREYQVRIEGLGVKFPEPTRQAQTTRRVRVGGSFLRKPPFRQPAQLASGSGNKPTAHLKSFLRQLLGDLTGAFDEALDNWT